MGRVRVAIVSLVFLLNALAVVHGGATEAVFAALQSQDEWLSRSTNGPAWNSYLRTEELRETLAAPSVDRRLLASVLARYRSGASGLEMRPFVRTRRALAQLADELRIPRALRWAEETKAAKQFTAPISSEEVLQAKQEVADSKSRLDEYLSQADTATRDGWKSFLKWDDLEEHLSDTSVIDWKKLDGVVIRLFNGYPGLEFPRFVDLREALRKYSYLGKTAESPDSTESLQQFYQALSESLEQYNTQPTTKHASDVAALADWLKGIGRDRGLADRLRAAHAQPNIHLRISEALLSRRFSQPVNDSSPVNEMILKTHVMGTAITNGTITTDVVPNPNAAQIDIVFNGVTTTRSRGRQTPVTINSTSVANLVARKPLFLYPATITSSPTRATGNVQTTIHGITPDNRLGRKLITNIAWKRAQEQKPQTERIASGRARRRLEAKIDEQTQELLGRARASLREQIQGPINRRGLIPETIRTSSTETHAIVTATQAGKGQLAAMAAPPSVPWQNDVIAQVHESAINNTAEKAIAGLTLTDERIAELVNELTGSVPDSLKINEGDQPWSISFDWKQPVTVEFDDQKMKLSVRGRRFTSGERVLNKVMEISGVYIMQVVPEKGVVLTRQGDVEVTFPGTKEGSRLRASDRIFKTLMEEKFSQLFQPVIEGEGFTLPGRFSQLGTIRLNQLSTKDGWLSLGWK